MKGPAIFDLMPPPYMDEVMKARNSERKNTTRIILKRP